MSLAVSDEPRFLFEVNVEVSSVGRAHSYYAEATLTCVTWANNEDEALDKTLAHLATDGYEILPRGHGVARLDPDTWDQYLDARWRGLVQAGLAPTRDQILSARHSAQQQPMHLSFYPHE